MDEREFWRVAESTLTDKQLAVLRYKAAGFSKRRIATILDVSVGTVESHTRAAETKLRRVFFGAVVVERFERRLEVEGYDGENGGPALPSLEPAEPGNPS